MLTSSPQSSPDPPLSPGMEAAPLPQQGSQPSEPRSKRRGKLHRVSAAAYFAMPSVLKKAQRFEGGDIPKAVGTLAVGGHCSSSRRGSTEPKSRDDSNGRSKDKSRSPPGPGKGDKKWEQQGSVWVRKRPTGADTHMLLQQAYAELKSLRQQVEIYKEQTESMRQEQATRESNTTSGLVTELIAESRELKRAVHAEQTRISSLEKVSALRFRVWLLSCALPFILFS